MSFIFSLVIPPFMNSFLLIQSLVPSITVPLHSFTHGIVHAFIRACIHFPLQLVFHSHSSMYIFPNSSPMRSSIDSLIAIHFFVESIIHSFIRLFVHFFFRSETFRHLVIHPSFIRSFNHPLVLPFTCSLARRFTHFCFPSFFIRFFLCSSCFFIHSSSHWLIGFLFSIIHSGAGVAMVRLRIVLSGGAGSMHHPYTISLSHILFYLSPLQKLIHERVCTFVCSSFNHLQTHPKVPRSPPLAHATCRPATCSFRRSPTHSIQWPMHSPIYSCIGCIDLLTRSAYSLIHSRICGFSPAVNFILTWFFVSHSLLQLFLKRSVDILELRNFDPHRTSVTSPVSHIACPSRNRHGTSRVSDIINRSQAHFISHDNHITHQSHHPQTFANTVPCHTHNTRIPSHITHISRHTSFTSPTSHITCHFQRPDFNLQRSSLSAHIHQIAFDLTLVLRLHTCRQPI